VLLRWCIQHGLPVITKSTHSERIQENPEIFDLALSHEDVAELNELDDTAAVPTEPSSASGGEISASVGA